MTRDEGLRRLGLDTGATPREVQRAYRTRALPLKTQVLTAPRVTLKDRYRGDLRELVLAREAALGQPLRKNWATGGLPVDGAALTEKLREFRTDNLDRDGARAFFGLEPRAKQKEVLAAYRACARALVRSFVSSDDDAQMKTIRRARAKLRTVRNFAS